MYAFKLFPIEKTHRATAFEVFFDLVFVFALTRIIALMAPTPTLEVLAQGLVLMLLLWWLFVTYCWLANQARADVGVMRAGGLVVMTAIFVVAFEIPDVWRQEVQSVAAPLTVVVAYIVIRGVFLALGMRVSAGDSQLRRRLLRNIIPRALGIIPLALGLVFYGRPQVLLWAAAFLIGDGIGGRIVPGGYPVRSTSHLEERYALVLIIALGESLLAAGEGAASPISRLPVLLAALLALAATVCLWWLYFQNRQSLGGKALEQVHAERRVKIASDAYGLVHFLLIAGILYLALGVEEVIAEVAHRPPGHFGGGHLNWASTLALYGGVVLYFVGRALFLWLTAQHNPPAHVIAAGVLLLLLPVARFLPALVALALVTAMLIGLICYERPGWGPIESAQS